MPVAAFLLAFSGGFLFYHIYSKNYDKLPNFKIKRFEFFPSVKVKVSGKIIYFHHWLSFSILLVISIFVEGGFLSYIVTKGILSGAAIQGLLSTKNFKIIYDSDK